MIIIENIQLINSIEDLKNVIRKDIQARKYQLTINNPEKHGYSDNLIKELCEKCNARYYCFAHEIGNEKGTEHVHIFIMKTSSIRFSTMKDRFPGAHIEVAHGSAKQNRDYITKSGKWAGTDKGETVVEGSFYENDPNLPTEEEIKNPKMFQLKDDLLAGKTTAEIVLDDPSFGFKIHDIDMFRETLLYGAHNNNFRDIRVHYLYGDPGTGKTKSIYEKHSFDEIFRVTNYDRNGVKFDNYHGQKVLVFEEFHSSIPINEMLNYLDIYPLELPARYNNKTACYTEVYITSNAPIEDQYIVIQEVNYLTYRAFLRRIDDITKFNADGTVENIKNDFLKKRSDEIEQLDIFTDEA